MAYIIQDDKLGFPRIGSSDTIARLPIGTIAHAVDQTWGGGEFIYLPGAASVVAGSLVGYDIANKSVALGATPSSGSPVAFATGAIGAGSYGWFQVTGVVQNAAKDGTALTAAGTVGLGTVAGTVGAVVATRQLLNAKALNAASAGATSGVIEISRPCVAQS